MTAFLAWAVILVLAALGVYLVVAVSGASGGRGVAPGPGRPQVDRAQEELRLRYARGEIDREEYLQRRIDLE